MTTTIARQYVREALGRIQRVLVDAAGEDQKLTKKELSDALAQLAPTERAAVDAFAAELDGRIQVKKRGPVTVVDIEQAVLKAQLALAPETSPPLLDLATLKSAKSFGDGLVRLALRLSGEPGAVLPPFNPAQFEGKTGATLLQAIRESAGMHVSFSYGSARDVLFGRVDPKEGKITEVYGGRQVPALGRHELADQHQVNTEHTQPQSMGVEGTPAKSDMHHLFPTDSEANSKRSSLPFGDVVSDIVWEKHGAKLGNNSAGELVFEPPQGHKGDAARALFYIAAVYGLPIPPNEEQALRRWNGEDPVDDKERARNDAISAHQENRNPFVDVPGLLERLDDI